MSGISGRRGSAASVEVESAVERGALPDAPPEGLKRAFQDWMPAVDEFFWELQHDLRTFVLDADMSSDVMVLKERVRSWLSAASEGTPPGLAVRPQWKGRNLTNRTNLLSAITTVDTLLEVCTAAACQLLEG